MGVPSAALVKEEGPSAEQEDPHSNGIFSSSLPCAVCLTHSLIVLAEVEFNVSEAFVPLSTPNSNHSSHTGNDFDSGTQERKRPASMAVMEGDLVKKERCV